MFFLLHLLPAFAADCTATRTSVHTCRAECSARDVPACLTLGYLLETGLGVPQPPPDPSEVHFHGEFDEKYGGYEPPPSARDLAGAEVAYARACTLGSPDGCLSLGVLQKLSGDDSRAKHNFEKAFAGWTASCETGVGRHCQLMAAACWGNWGHASDAASSYTWSVRACELEDGRGCWAQAEALMKGQGVKKDPDQAEKLYRTSCDALGSVVGCLALRDLYAVGGLKPNATLEKRYVLRTCDLDPAFCRDR